MNKKVKYFDEFLNEAESIEPIVATSYEHLKKLISQAINENGNEVDLNYIDVSNMYRMDFLFSSTGGFPEFNGDISKWDVSKVTDMSWMFDESKFNGDISKWDVSNVTKIQYMFKKSKFNGDISKWNVSNVTDMQGMFEESNFNQDISKWDVSNVTDMTGMFRDSPFNYDISKWKVGLNTKIDNAFNRNSLACYKKPIESNIYFLIDVYNVHKVIGPGKENTEKELDYFIKNNREKATIILSKVPKSEKDLYNFIIKTFNKYYNDDKDISTLSDLNDIGF